MATPIGHALGGYVAYKVGISSTEKPSCHLLSLCLFLAVLPDLDFIPGLFIGKPATFHQGITHSLGAAVVLSVVAAFLYSKITTPPGRFLKVWGVCCLAYGSHLVIDVFGPDGRPPYGIPIFWPFSETSYLAPVQIFWGVRHASSTSNTTGEWFWNIFDLYNVGAIGVEIVVISPMILLIGYIKNLKNAA